MPKAKELFRDKKVRESTCEFLDINSFAYSSTGEVENIENCSCAKHNETLPNGIVAMTYCCQQGTHGICWYDVANDKPTPQNTNPQTNPAPKKTPTKPVSFENSNLLQKKEIIAQLREKVRNDKSNGTGTTQQRKDDVHLLNDYVRKYNSELNTQKELNERLTSNIIGAASLVGSWVNLALVYQFFGDGSYNYMNFAYGGGEGLSRKGRYSIYGNYVRLSEGNQLGITADRRCLILPGEKGTDGTLLQPLPHVEACRRAKEFATRYMAG